MKTDYDNDLKTEVYTELLNKMHATICKFLRTNPNNEFKDELTKQYKKLSIAYGESRFYYDKEHYDNWESLLENSKQLLRKAGYINAF